MLRADNLTTFICHLFWNLRSWASWNPQACPGLYRDCFTFPDVTKIIHSSHLHWMLPLSFSSSTCISYHISSHFRYLSAIFLFFTCYPQINILLLISEITAWHSHWWALIVCKWPSSHTYRGNTSRSTPILNPSLQTMHLHFFLCCTEEWPW